MSRRTRASSVVTSAALIAMFVAGCSAPVNESGAPASLNPTPPSTTVAPPSATPAPTETAPPTGLVSDIPIHWGPDSSLKEAGFIRDVVRGDHGLVAIGDCYPERTFECPQVWHSSDARTWSRHPLPHRWPDVWPNAVAVGATGYVISGAERDLAVGGPLPVAQQWLRIWASPDGKAWKRIGVLRIGDEAYFLALAPTGRIIVGTGSFDESSTGLFSSADALEWRAVKPADLGVEALRVEYLESTATEVVLAGSPCDGCGHQLWTSTDSLHWAAKGPIPGSPRSFATDGRVRVVTWGSEIWTSTDDGPWVLRYAQPDLEDTQVIVTPFGFLAVGGGEGGYSLLTSVDGLTWASVANDGLPVQYDDDCAPGWLTTSGETILLGQDNCPFWQGTVGAR